MLGDRSIEVLCHSRSPAIGGNDQNMWFRDNEGIIVAPQGDALGGQPELLYKTMGVFRRGGKVRD